METASTGAGGASGSGAAGNGASGSGAGGGRATGGTSFGGRAGSSGAIGDGGSIGVCNPSFCQPQAGAIGCCVGPNGPCGLDFGNGCTPRAPDECQYDSDCPVPQGPCQLCPDGTCAPLETHCQNGACVTLGAACPVPVPPSCNPAFCPSDGMGKPCCMGQNGSCGLDYGMGCMPPNTCPPGGCVPPPPMQVPTWQKGCVPDVCDAGVGPPLCNPGNKEFAGNPCNTIGQQCALTLGCTPVLVCSQYPLCATPL